MEPLSGRRPSRRTVVRAVFAVLVLLLAGFLVSSATVDNQPKTAKSELREQADLPFEDREQVVPPRGGTTVVTTSPRADTQGSIVAFAPDGRLLYYNDTFTKYFDVDPVPNTSHTVVYSAGRGVPAEECIGTQRPCAYVAFRTVNLSTGEGRTLYGFYARSGIPHDVEWLNDTHLLVAEGGKDRVFVLNHTSGLKTWTWQAQSHYTGNVGGVFPDDWSHLNDVDPLPDGRYMISVRNMDQVVIVNRSGYVTETLGSEDARETLYEQHNPDYIPEARGGPAILVADSENNRIVEYQQTGEGWTRSWVWRDARMQWPRDADRLPNGHTLITDSDGNRIIEVDRQGRVVWQIHMDTAYEAERLDTGKGSTGGEAASRLGLSSHTGGISDDPPENETAPAASDDRSFLAGILGSVVLFVKDLLPGIVVNGILIVLPPWFGVFQLFATAALGALVVGWAAIEVRWSAWTVELSIRKR